MNGRFCTGELQAEVGHQDCCWLSTIRARRAYHLRRGRRSISACIRVGFAMTSQVRPLESEADATAALEDGDVLWLSTAGFALDGRGAPAIVVRCAGQRQERQLRSGDRRRGRQRPRRRRPPDGCAGCSRGSATRRTRSCGRTLPGVPRAPARAGGRASGRSKWPAAPRPGGRTTRACTSTAFRRRPCAGSGSCACSPTSTRKDGRGRGGSARTFDAVGRRFAPRLRMPAPGAALVLRAFGDHEVAPLGRTTR